MGQYTTVSYAGSRDDTDKLGKLAAVLGLKMGELVRIAVDTTYGEQLRQIDEISSTMRRQQNVHPAKRLSSKSGLSK